jgi:hypothetical protein
MSENLMTAHNQWKSRPADQRFETLGALAASVQARRMQSRAMDVDLARIEVASLGDDLQINGTITPCEPSHWAFGQLCSWSKVNGVTAPAQFMRQLPATLVAQNLNYALRNGRSEALKFMTVARGEQSEGGSELNTLQAVTSPTYGRIWDADVCGSVSRLVERSGGRWFNPKAYVPGSNVVKPSGLYASDHDIFIFMIDGGSFLDAGPRAQLHRGFIVGNSETGAKTFFLIQFLHNGVCGNHIIWGASNVNEIIIRHTEGGPARFEANAAPALLAYANASAAPELAAIRKAQDYLLPAPVLGAKNTTNADDMIVEFARSKGKFSKSEVKEAITFARREEGDCRTLWQLVQGGTAYARGFDYVDARTETETRFSALLNLAKN